MKLITALATPFKNDKIDTKSYQRLLKHQCADELLCAGTTAEGALLSVKEKQQLIEVTKSETATPLWVGISNGCTKKAVEEGKLAKNCGANGLLVTPPSFFKCTENGFVRHICEIYDATQLPIMLYNAPSRCGYQLWQKAVEKLQHLKICIKDAGNDLVYAKNISQNIPLYCGNEEHLEDFIQGAETVGVVSVVSNAFPQLVKTVCDCYKVGQHNQATTFFEKLATLMFQELNPIPIKYLLFKLGIFETFDMRLPLTSATCETQKAIDDFLKNYSSEV